MINMIYELTWLAPRLYLGVYKLRSSGGCYYFHIPVRLASLETRRVRIPSKFRSLAESVKDCGSVDVWIEHIPDHFNHRKEGRGI
jgi:hypothetical protein